ncbi:protease, partial [Nocardia elegans]|nr:protease [Nocardia elegans]
MIAASAAILLFGPTAAVANAEPAPATDLPAQLVEALNRDLKLSPEEYLRRADLAQQDAAFA